MAKKQEAAEVADVVSVPTAEVVDEKTVDEPAEESKSAQRRKAAMDGSIAVKYRDHRGEPTERTFSKDVHGEDFAELAAEFKKANASRIID